jgi:hypothetical protein
VIASLIVSPSFTSHDNFHRQTSLPPLDATNAINETNKMTLLCNFKILKTKMLGWIVPSCNEKAPDLAGAFLDLISNLIIAG